jgi:hypothetical protein
VVKFHGKNDILLTPSGDQKGNGFFEQEGRSIVGFGDGTAGWKIKPGVIDYGEGPAEWKSIPRKNAGSHCLECNADLALDSDFHLNGKARIKTSGMLFESFQYVDPEERKPFLKKTMERLFEKALVKEFSVSELSDTAAVFMVDMSVDLKAQACDTSGLFLLTVLKPVLESLHVDASPVQRTTPLALPHAYREKIRVTLSLPENIKIVSHPDAYSVSNAASSVRFSSKAEGMAWTIERGCLFPKQQVQPSEYQAFREAVSRTEPKMDRSWLVEKK